MTYDWQYRVVSYDNKRSKLPCTVFIDQDILHSSDILDRIECLIEVQLFFNFKISVYINCVKLRVKTSHDGENNLRVNAIYL